MKDPRVGLAIAWLAKHGTQAGRDSMARYAIASDKAFGVPMNRIQALAKELGKDHALAQALWETDRCASSAAPRSRSASRRNSAAILPDYGEPKRYAV